MGRHREIMVGVREETRQTEGKGDDGYGVWSMGYGVWSMGYGEMVLYILKYVNNLAQHSIFCCSYCSDVLMELIINNY